MKIAAIVSRKLVPFEVVCETTPLGEAVRLMHARSIGSVGVRAKDGTEIVGLISQQELTSAIATQGSGALLVPVAFFMLRPALSCRCEDNAADVMRIMTRERSRHVVVQSAQAKPADIVSLGDLVAALLAEAQLEAGVLRDMARSHLLAVSA